MPNNGKKPDKQGAPVQGDLDTLSGFENRCGSSQTKQGKKG